MTALADVLPLTETITPTDQAALAAGVREASERRMAMYPIGGGASLDFGLPARTPGIGVSLAGLNRVIDYPARDMTITVEAGLAMSALAEALAAERQWLPIETPAPEQATIGGVMATAWSGPRRYGWGTMRDYVIGVSAVDGRGVPFKAGGRVVKNVAGYDFCKLLTGSLGGLAIITQVTLKIKPRPERSALMACRVASPTMAEEVLAALVTTAVAPSAIEYVSGPAWRDDAAVGDFCAGSAGAVIVGLEGSAAEVEWMTGQLDREWAAARRADVVRIADADAVGLWRRLSEFAATAGAPLVIKASLTPSSVCSFVEVARAVDPSVSITAHAGNGVVVARFADLPVVEAPRALIGKLRPAAVTCGGNLIVLSCAAPGDMTRPAYWGGGVAATEWMTKIKRQFDPYNLLNPGRLAY